MLHLTSHFLPALRNVRDLIFTTLAFPLALFVSCTFWMVFYIDRELIFPSSLDEFFPPWLNHSIHTVIVPVNILLIIIERHRYFKFGFMVTCVQMGSYVIFLYYIKSASGYNVYPYLDELGSKVHFYYASCVLQLYTMYQTGALLNAFLYTKQFNTHSIKMQHKEAKKNK